MKHQFPRILRVCAFSLLLVCIIGVSSIKPAQAAASCSAKATAYPQGYTIGVITLVGCDQVVSSLKIQMKVSRQIGTSSWQVITQYEATAYNTNSLSLSKATSCLVGSGADYLYIQESKWYVNGSYRGTVTSSVFKYKCMG
jgi:hypothetical protein